MPVARPRRLTAARLDTIRSTIAVVTPDREGTGDQRLLLFMLAELQNKAAMLAFVRRELPGVNPEDFLWDGLVAMRPALGVPVDDLATLLFESLFDQVDEAQLLERLRETFDPRDLAERLTDIRDLRQQLADLPVFRNLFAPDAEPAR
jgi:hypothetical protein